MRNSIQHKFWRKFIFLIVIPILFLLCIAITIFLGWMRQETETNLEILTDNYALRLEKEITDNSLQLSQFLLVNDNQMINYLIEYSEAGEKEQYSIQKKMMDRYNCLVIPKQQLLSIRFGFHANESYSFKNYINIPNSTLRKKEWYQKGVKEPDIVHVSVEDYSDYFSVSKEKGKKIFVFSMVPHMFDEQDKISFVTMCMRSTTLDDITSGELDETSIYVVDQNGTIIVQSDNEYDGELRKILKEDNNTSVPYKTHVMKKNGWKVIGISHSKGDDFRYKIFLVSIVIFSIILFAIFNWCVKSFFATIVKPIVQLSNDMTKFHVNQSNVVIDHNSPNEITQIQDCYNQMTEEIGKLLEENAKKEYERHKEELNALQLQINPHFLSNSLNTIRFMAQVAKYEGIEKITEALMQIVDCSFRNQQGMYTIGEELDMLDAYIYIMKIRYAESFTIQFDVQQECKDCLIPRIMLQPFVENSIIHGFSDGLIEGEITISIYQKENTIQIKIRDNGSGIEEEQRQALLHDEVQSKHIGVANVRKRLSLYYGEHYSFEIHSSLNEFTEIWIEIPVMKGGQ